MKVLLTGSNGQLGQALRLSLPKAIKGEQLELIATSRQGGDGMLALDLGDGDACGSAVVEQRPTGCSMRGPIPQWIAPKPTLNWPIA